MSECLFCNIDRETFLENELSYAVFDRYPVSNGHVLIIPKRHINSFVEASKEEISAMFELIVTCQRILENKFQPDGYNIGVNIGETAGQSIFHLHIHLIPRYKGDHPDPRGGVRNIIPHKH